MTNIGGFSLNGKFDDTINLDGKDVKANVKKLAEGVTFAEAQQYLDKPENKDGYDTIGVTLGNDKFLIQVKEDLINTSAHTIKFGDKSVKFDFSENEINTESESQKLTSGKHTVEATVGAIGALIGGGGGIELGATIGNGARGMVAGGVIGAVAGAAVLAGIVALQLSDGGIKGDITSEMPTRALTDH